MPRTLRTLNNRLRFRWARYRAGRERQQLCATLMPSGQPVYFAMPRDASDEEIRDRAFQIRYGRELMPFERQLMASAGAWRQRHQGA